MKNKSLKKEKISEEEAKSIDKREIKQSHHNKEINKRVNITLPKDVTQRSR